MEKGEKNPIEFVASTSLVDITINKVNSEKTTEAMPGVEDQDLVVYESDYKCQVYPIAGCAAMKGHVCVDLSATPFMIPCDSLCDECEQKVCVKERALEINAGGTLATKDLCSTTEAVDKLTTFYANIGRKNEEEFMYGGANMVTSIAQTYCRCCDLGKELYEETMSNIEEIEEEIDDRYEKEALDELAGGSVEQLIENLEKDMQNGKTE